MYKLAIAIFLLSLPLVGQEILIQPLRIDASHLLEKKPTPLKIEHASHPEKRQWGLMGRKSLPLDQGMLLYLTPAPNKKIWMFNCFLNLSVAVLDKGQVIRQVEELQAYPHLMDPERPVRTPKDLSLYPPHDPIVQFFQKKSLKLPQEAAYVLEMNQQWFPNHQTRAGDVLIWDLQNKKDFILHTLDLSDYVGFTEKPLLLEFKEAVPRAVWVPRSVASCEVAFLDDHLKVIKSGSLKAENSASHLSPVLFSKNSIKYIMVVPSQWLRTHHVQSGTQLTIKD